MDGKIHPEGAAVQSCVIFANIVLYFKLLVCFFLGLLTVALKVANPLTDRRL